MISDFFKREVAPFYKKWSICGIYVFEGMMNYEGVLGATNTWLLGFDWFDENMTERHQYLLDNHFLTREEHDALLKFVPFFHTAMFAGVPPRDMMREDLYEIFLRMREELFAIPSLKEVLEEIEAEYSTGKGFYNRSYLDVKRDRE